MFGIEKFKQYISDVRFTIITDHKALVYLRDLKDTNVLLFRWSFIIGSLDCDIIYRQGLIHTVDAISRLIVISKQQQAEVSNAICNALDTIIKESKDAPESDLNDVKLLDPYLNENLMYFLQKNKFKSGLSHKAIYKLKMIAHNYDFDGINVVYFKDHNKIGEVLIVPEINKRIELINICH